MKYNGKNNNKGFNKVTYIEINPNKIISSLSDIQKKEIYFRKQLFDSIHKQILLSSRNNQNNNINYNSSISKNEPKNFYYDILDNINMFKKRK